MTLIRAATAQDVPLWRALRRDGIERYPAAFLLSLAEHDASSPDRDAARLAAGQFFLAFEGETAIGMIGLNQMSLERARHRAEIGPVYVTPAAQGHGTARALIQTALDAATASGIWQIELTVNEDNSAAIALYTAFGFTQTGRIPNAVIGADGPEHDLIMLRELPHPP